MRNVKRIVKIHKIHGYKINCLFNNGESRIINFKALFDNWNVGKNDLEYKLKESLEEFKKVELIDGTLTWKNITIDSLNDEGIKVQYYYEIDPIVLYESSVMDVTRKIDVGLMIKKVRNELGLSQTELAERSGTSKHYISRIENNKSGIELSTLVKIIEGGLGKRLEINIV